MDKAKQWIALAAVAVIAILAAGWFLVVSPKRSEAADEAAFTAARAAACGGFVRGLPDGYHTIVASAGLDSRERSASASVSLGRCCSGRRFAFSRRRPRPSILRPRWRSAPPWCR